MKTILITAFVLVQLPCILIAQPFIKNQELSENIINLANGHASWADFDQDGDHDLLISGDNPEISSTDVYRNETGTGFTKLNLSFPALHHSCVSWMDFNNDNYSDIFLSGLIDDEPFSFIYKNNGNQDFTEIPSLIPGVKNGSSLWGDLDNDGLQNLVLLGEVNNGGFTGIFHNSGNSFEEIETSLQQLFDGEIALGDYDNDMDLDILLTGSFKSGNDIYKTLQLYRNDGDFSFQLTNNNFFQMNHSNVAWGDFDGDGDLDILSNGSPDGPTHLIHIYRNDDGIFYNIGIEIYGAIDGSVEWGDFDNDGDLDFLISGLASYNNSPIFEIYEQEIGNLFHKVEDLNIEGTFKGNCSWVDFDQDGDLDIFTMGYTDMQETEITTSFYENMNTLINHAPTAPTNLSQTVNNNEVVFSWKAATDIETADSNLTYNLRIGTEEGLGDIITAMSNDDGFFQITGKGNVNHNLGWKIIDLDKGNYFWSVQSVDNNFATSGFSEEMSFEIVNTGFRLEDKNEIKVFLNPSHSEIIIAGINFEDKALLSLYDISGKLLIADRLINDDLHYRLDISKYNSGVYIIAVTSNRKNLIKKIAK